MEVWQEVASQPLREFCDYNVATRLSKRRVDFLEPVKVGMQDRDASFPRRK